MKSYIFVAQIVFASAALVKKDANDPGARVWMGHGGCTGQKSPVGMSVKLVLSDPFLFMGLPGKPLADKFLSKDKKHLTASAQDFFCNASVWIPFFAKIRPTLTAVRGKWVFQSSYAFNLCGMGYATGSWKSFSEYMKTLESEGAAGTTVFMGTTPSRYMNCAELCQGVAMPTTVSSLVYYHLKYPGGSLVLKVLGAQNTGNPYSIEIPSMDWNAGPFYAWGYAVGVVCSLVCVITLFLGITGIQKLTNKQSFASLILGYESIASLFRAILFLSSAPIPWGFAFYNGLGTNTLNNMQTILGPFGIPTTFLTACVWLKFTAYRSTPPAFVDPIIMILTAAVLIGSWVGALQMGVTYESAGILLASVQDTAEKLRGNVAIIKIAVTSASFCIFLVANILWLLKLKKVSSSSPQLAAVARRCMKIMTLQGTLLLLTLINDGANLKYSFSPLLNPNGELALNINQISNVFIEAPAEALLGLSQVVAIRALSSSSSSSSSSSCSS